MAEPFGAQVEALPLPRGVPLHRSTHAPATLLVEDFPVRGSERGPAAPGAWYRRRFEATPAPPRVQTHERLLAQFPRLVGRDVEQQQIAKDSLAHVFVQSRNVVFERL